MSNEKQMREALQAVIAAHELGMKELGERMQAANLKSLQVKGQAAIDAFDAIEMARQALALPITPPAAAPAPAEPFGHFRAEPFGWTDCAADDEGAIALYERPAAPAVPQDMRLVPVWLLKNVEQSLGSFVSDLGWAQADMDTMDSVSALLAATPLQEPIKDHVIREAVNQLRDCAVEFHATQQLRERIAGIVVPLLKSAPAAPSQPVTPDPVWCHYVAGMVFGWLQMQKQLPDEERCIEAIAGIIQRRLWAYKPSPEQVTLTDEEARAIYASTMLSLLEKTEGVIGGPDVVALEMPTRFAHAIIAALREKGALR